MSSNSKEFGGGYGEQPLTSEHGIIIPNEPYPGALSEEAKKYFSKRPKKFTIYENPLFGIPKILLPTYYNMYPAGIFHPIFIPDRKERRRGQHALQIGIAGPVYITPKVEIHDSIHIILDQPVSLSCCPIDRVEYLSDEEHDGSYRPKSAQDFIQDYDGPSRLVSSLPNPSPLLILLANNYSQERRFADKQAMEERLRQYYANQQHDPNK